MDSDDLFYVFLIVIVVTPATFFLMPALEKLAARIGRK